MKESQISFSFLLGLAFIVLKLCKVIGWSWWWVTAPFWVPVVISIAMIVIGYLGIYFSVRKHKK
jgi:phosphoglycerol transferase MdoB-like AlkP superfamily enzyme